ncbi:MAG: CCA tRNA nucleotidyltransferase, partial [Clostridium sp.]
FYGHNTVGEKITKKALRRLKFDNKTIDRVSKLVREHMNVLDPPTKGAIKRLIGRVSLDDIYNLFSLQEADIKSLAINKEPLAKFYIMKEKAIEIINLKEPISIKDLDIDGSALIKELNIKPSKIIGEILNHLLSLVIDDPSLNSYPILLENATKYIKTLGN